MTKTQRNSAAASNEAFHRYYAAIYGEERWHKSLYPALGRPTRYAALLNLYANPSSTRQQFDKISELDDLEQLHLPNNVRDAAQQQCKEVQYQSICLVDPKQQILLDDSSATTSALRPSSFPAPWEGTEPNGERLLSHWNLDAASLLVADILNVQPGDKVLDLCASPGGKSVALSQRLFPHLHNTPNPPPTLSLSNLSTLSNLHSNEPDPTRHKRLQANLKSYLPATLFHPIRATPTSPQTHPIHVLNHDASHPSLSTHLPTKSYSHVLVDAPCSSERHLVHTSHPSTATNSKPITAWSPASSTRLAKLQASILMNGLRAAKREGGIVVYATCALGMAENDRVVERVLGLVEKERRKVVSAGGRVWGVEVVRSAWYSRDEVGSGNDGGTEGDGNGEREKGKEDGGNAEEAEFVARLEKEWAERTEYGWIVLPDHPGGGGWGPLYFAMLRKIPG